jgi:hypothetical protein
MMENEINAEPLRPGDVIMYHDPVLVVSRDSRRQAQVRMIEPDSSNIRLSLSTSDLLPLDHEVRRIQEYKDGEVIAHPGLWRPIEHFRLCVGSLTEEDQSGLSGLRDRGVRLHEIIDTGVEEFSHYNQQDAAASSNDDSSDDDNDDQPAVFLQFQRL